MSEEDRQDTADDAEGGVASEKKENAKQEVRKAKKRIEEGADKAMEEFDQSVVDLLAWLLDTETRARIYVYLRQHPNSTSEEVASGTGLYPSTVREALAELHEEGTVDRGKRESEGAGNNPYEYEAISPSDLVSGAVGQVQNQLNAVFNLDQRLRRGEAGDDEGPVTITVGDDERPIGTVGDMPSDGDVDDEDSEATGGNAAGGQSSEAGEDDAEGADDIAGSDADLGMDDDSETDDEDGTAK